jgi:hypothetical protein
MDVLAGGSRFFVVVGWNMGREAFPRRDATLVDLANGKARSLAAKATQIWIN